MDGHARGRDVQLPVRPAQRVHARLVHRREPARRLRPLRLHLASAAACAARDSRRPDRDGALELHDRREDSGRPEGRHRQARAVHDRGPRPVERAQLPPAGPGRRTRPRPSPSSAPRSGRSPSRRGTYRYQCDPARDGDEGGPHGHRGRGKKTKVSGFRVRRSGRRAIVSVKVDQAVSARIQLLRRSRVVSGFSGKLRAGDERQAPRARRVPAGTSSVSCVIENGSKRTYRTPSALLGGRSPAGPLPSGPAGFSASLLGDAATCAPRRPDHGARCPCRLQPTCGRAGARADPDLGPGAAGAPAPAGPPRRARLSRRVQPAVRLRETPVAGSAHATRSAGIPGTRGSRRSTGA